MTRRKERALEFVGDQRQARAGECRHRKKSWAIVTEGGTKMFVTSQKNGSMKTMGKLAESRSKWSR
jgi:hypothetical protein